MHRHRPGIQQAKDEVKRLNSVVQELEAQLETRKQELKDRNRELEDLRRCTGLSSLNTMPLDQLTQAEYVRLLDVNHELEVNLKKKDDELVEAMSKLDATKNPKESPKQLESNTLVLIKPKGVETTPHDHTEALIDMHTRDIMKSQTELGKVRKERKAIQAEIRQLRAAIVQRKGPSPMPLRSSLRRDRTINYDPSSTGQSDV